MLSDKDLMKKLGVDSKTLSMFKRVRASAIAEAKRMARPKKGKINVLGISGSARDRLDTAAEDSNSEALLKECLSHCRKMGARTELIPLRKYEIKYCKACYSTTNTQCHFYCSCYPRGKNGDDMTNILYDKVIAADAIIIATPVNNFKISAPLADFLDRCISLDGSLKPANPDAPKDRELNIKHMKYIELTADQEIPGSGTLRRFLGKTAGVIVTGHEAGASLAISNLFMALNQFGMVFPPFSSMYAMSSICNSTYEDKKIVLSKCFMEETELLAKNVMRCAKTARSVKPTDWAYDYTAD
ncbi:MAG: NAD(P)H-dependent oxidoreductase [Candidatus Micrarchaeia archaeon]|jgi:multimeric flavodoxin WrbA